MNEMSNHLNSPAAPFLSICIPTFNRECFLKECLDALQEFWVLGVEVVVSDNASTDGTIAMLESFAHELPLRWGQNATNLGFDRNLATVVSMARGKYCWVLGSDDCITPDALSKVIGHLRLHDPDILHFGYVQADIAMRPLSRAVPPSSTSPIAMTPAEVPKYLTSLPNVSFLFAFISSFIFRRERWLEHTDRLSNWLDSHYVHAYMLHAMLAAGATVLSSEECFVTARGGNPNEFNSAAGRMLALDAITLQRIHREVFKEKPHLLALGRVFRRSYSARTVINIASQGGMPMLIMCYPALKALGISRFLIRGLQICQWLRLLPLLRRAIVWRRHAITNVSAINHTP